MTNHIFFQSWPVIGQSNSYAAQAQTAKHTVVLHPALQLINPQDIYKKWVIERENWLKKIKMQQRNEL